MGSNVVHKVLFVYEQLKIIISRLYKNKALNFSVKYIHNMSYEKQTEAIFEK